MNQYWIVDKIHKGREIQKWWKEFFKHYVKFLCVLFFFKIFLSSWEIDEWWEISGRRIVFSFVWFRKEIRDKLIIEGVQVVSTLTQKCGKKNTSKLPKLHFLFLDIQPPITFFFLNQPFIPSLSLSLSLSILKWVLFLLVVWLVVFCPSPSWESISWDRLIRPMSY